MVTIPTIPRMQMSFFLTSTVLTAGSYFLPRLPHHKTTFQQSDPSAKLSTFMRRISKLIHLDSSVISFKRGCASKRANQIIAIRSMHLDRMKCMLLVVLNLRLLMRFIHLGSIFITRWTKPRGQLDQDNYSVTSDAISLSTDPSTATGCATRSVSVASLTPFLDNEVLNYARIHQSSQYSPRSSYYNQMYPEIELIHAPPVSSSRYRKERQMYQDTNLLFALPI